MIGKLFPRVLNKSSDKSAIKPHEFSDALNVLVTSDDGGDGNVIKKINGTITALINDPANFPVLDQQGSTVSDNVIGHLVDESKERIYYFCSGRSGGQENSVSSIYVAQQTGVDEIKITCLLRDDDLGFSQEDFVSANIISVPKVKKDTGADQTVSGQTGDLTSPFEGSGYVPEDGELSSLQVVSPPSIATVYNITNEQWYEGAVQVGGSLTLENYGSSPALVNLLISVSSNFPGSPTVYFNSNSGTSISELEVSGASSVSIGFTLTYNPVGVFSNTTIPFEVTVQEVDQGISAGFPVYEVYPLNTEFVIPTPVFPDAVKVNYNIDSIFDQAPVPDVPYVFSIGDLPENQNVQYIGPFTVEFIGGEPTEFQYRIPIELGVQVTNSEQEADYFWAFAGFNEIDTVNTSFTSSYNAGTNSYTIDPTVPYSQSTFTFYLAKAYDTTSWIEGGLNPLVETNIGMFFTYENPETQSQGNVAFNTGQAPFQEAIMQGTIADVPTPADIQVIQIDGFANNQIYDLDSNVDDGENGPTSSGTQETFSFTLQNFGELEGYFAVDIDWATVAFDELVAGYQASGLSINDWFTTYDSNRGGRFKGMWELITYEVVGSSGQILQAGLKPWSKSYINDLFAGELQPLGNFGSQSYFNGWFLTGFEPILLQPGETKTIRVRLDNTSLPLFGFAGIGPADLGTSDEALSDPYIGTNGAHPFWGSPNTGAEANSPGNLDRFTISVLTGDTENSSGFTNTVFSRTGSATVDTNYTGDLFVFAPKTPQAVNHPFLSTNINTTTLFDTLFAGQNVDQATFQGNYGLTTGENFVLAGYYQQSDVFKGVNKTIMPSPSTPYTWNALNFWKDAANGPTSIDLCFYNSTTIGDFTPASVTLTADTAVAYPGNLNGIETEADGVFGINGIIDVLGEIDIWTHYSELHTPVNTGGQGAGDATNTKTGSLGAAWLISDPFYLPPGIDYGTVGLPDYEGLFNTFSSWSSDPGDGAYDVPGGIGWNVPGNHWHGGWRTANFNVPPKHAVVARLVFNFQPKAGLPDPGLEDYTSNSQFTPFPDYNDPAQCWGIPAVLTASWTGAINNEEPNTVKLGMAAGYTDTQYNTVI